jgi:ribosomal protein L6P/L9E
MSNLVKYNLVSNFDFHFLEGKSLFFIKGINGILFLRLPNTFFFAKTSKSSFFFTQKRFFFSFVSHFLNSYKSVNKFFFVKLKLRGLGYRIRRLTKFFFRIFLGFTNYIFLHKPENVFLKTRRRRIIMMSSNYSALRTIVVHFLLLRNLTPYRLRGVFYSKQIILLKPGKKRF